MVVANTQAYYDTLVITALKWFIVQASEEFYLLCRWE